VSLLLPPTGGDTDGPAKPVPWCLWLAPKGSRTSCRYSFPLPGATPTARQSRFRGVSGSPPGCAHFVSLLLPPTGGDTDGPAEPVPWCLWLAPRMRALRVATPSPYRGRHRRPGRAGSVVSLARPQDSRTSCCFSLPLPGATPTARQSRFRGVSGSPPGFAHFVSLLFPPTGGDTDGPAKPVPWCLWH